MTFPSAVLDMPRGPKPDEALKPVAKFESVKPLSEPNVVSVKSARAVVELQKARPVIAAATKYVP